MEKIRMQLIFSSHERGRCIDVLAPYCMNHHLLLSWGQLQSTPNNTSHHFHHSQIFVFRNYILPPQNCSQYIYTTRLYRQLDTVNPIQPHTFRPFKLFQVIELWFYLVSQGRRYEFWTGGECSADVPTVFPKFCVDLLVKNVNFVHAAHLVHNVIVEYSTHLVYASPCSI